MVDKVKKGIRFIKIGILLMLPMVLLSPSFLITPMYEPIEEPIEDVEMSTGTILFILGLFSGILGFFSELFGFLTVYIGYKERKMELEKKNAGKV